MIGLAINAASEMDLQFSDIAFILSGLVTGIGKRGRGVAAQDQISRAKALANEAWVKVRSLGSWASRLQPFLNGLRGSCIEKQDRTSCREMTIFEWSKEKTRKNLHSCTDRPRCTFLQKNFNNYPLEIEATRFLVCAERAINAHRIEILARAQIALKLRIGAVGFPLGFIDIGHGSTPEQIRWNIPRKLPRMYW